MPYFATSTFMVAEQADGSYIIFPPTPAPTSRPLKMPTDVPGVYAVSGDLRLLFRNPPPEGPTTREAILAWIERIEQAGCTIRTGNYREEDLATFEE